MEQHKVLLIIVSVTIVLAAIVGVGLWLFYPRAADDADLAQNGAPESGGYEWQPLDYLQGQGDVPGLDESEAGTAGEPDEFQVTYGVVPDAVDAEPADRLPADRRTVVDIVGQAPAAETTGASVPGDRPVSAGTAGAAATRETSPTGPSVPAVADSGPSPAVATIPSTTPSTGSSTAAAPELADQAYWIQAISSPNRDTAEQAQLTLREHQLGSLILTKVIDGRTFYRLRIGPFAVRAEAEKFLAWVQEIDDFSDAMIFVDYTTPVLAARPG